MIPSRGANQTIFLNFLLIPKCWLGMNFLIHTVFLLGCVDIILLAFGFECFYGEVWGKRPFFSLLKGRLDLFPWLPPIWSVSWSPGTLLGYVSGLPIQFQFFISICRWKFSFVSDKFSLSFKQLLGSIVSLHFCKDYNSAHAKPLLVALQDSFIFYFLLF